MSKSKHDHDVDAISTILTKTQRLLKIEAQEEDTAFHQAQLLLSEYIVMLTESQSENGRLRQLLGSYVDSPAARRNVPASLMIATLQERIHALNAGLVTLRRALEKIEACETQAARRKPGEIAAQALRSVGESRSGATAKRGSRFAEPGRNDKRRSSTGTQAASRR